VLSVIEAGSQQYEGACGYIVSDIALHTEGSFVLVMDEDILNSMKTTVDLTHLHVCIGPFYRVKELRVRVLAER